MEITDIIYQPVCFCPECGGSLDGGIDDACEYCVGEEE